MRLGFTTLSTITNGSHTVESPPAKANMLNSYFTSNFQPPKSTINRAHPPAVPTLSEISRSNVEVYLNSLKMKIASGPDDISSRRCASTISSTYHLFNLSLSTGITKLNGITEYVDTLRNDYRFNNSSVSENMLQVPSFKTKEVF